MAERLGERIHRLRIERDQSLQDVAAATDTTKAHIWQIEKGRAKRERRRRPVPGELPRLGLVMLRAQVPVILTQ